MQRYEAMTYTDGKIELEPEADGDLCLYRDVQKLKKQHQAELAKKDGIIAAYEAARPKTIRDLAVQVIEAMRRLESKS